MLPLVGTATSVRRRFMGRPRCQTLAIAPLVTQRSRHRFLRRNPRQPQQACYFLDNQLGTYAVPIAPARAIFFWMHGYGRGKRDLPECSFQLLAGGTQLRDRREARCRDTSEVAGALGPYTLLGLDEVVQRLGMGLIFHRVSQRP